MSTAAASLRDRPLIESTQLERRWGPREGWSSLFLLAVAVTTVAVALDDANWAGVAPDRGRQTDFLPWGAVGSVLVGFLLAKSRLPVLTAHLVSALFASAWLLVSAAGAVSDAPGTLDRLRALAESAAIFYQDLVVLGVRSTETSVFLLVMGGLVWAIGQFAAFNLFRRRRVMPGVVLAGLALLVNVSITIRPQYMHLMVFAGVVMLLLVRMNLVSQREAWRIRRISDMGYAAGRFLRFGAGFVGVSLLGAIVLAGTATSAPLAGAWRAMDDQLLSVGSEINRWVGGVSGTARGPSGLFSSSQTIRGVWQASSEIVFRARTSDDGAYYWRGATYDLFDGFTWQQQDRQRVDVAAGGDLMAHRPNEPLDGDAFTEVTARVTSVDLAGGTVLAPAAAVSLDRDAEVLINGPAGPVIAVDLRDPIDPGGEYTVTSLVSAADAGANDVTAADLAAAGTDYPDWIARFLDIRPGSVGDLVHSTAERVVSRLPESRRDPYHVAEALQLYLFRDGGFQYAIDVRGLCGRDRIADCLLQTKVGYCEYFATTLTMLLRSQAIPARLAMGYLPGRRLADGSWEVDRSAAHAWVEVYFPDYGWVRFDPTPGNEENGQRPTTLEPGDPSDAPVRPVPSPQPSGQGDGAVDGPAGRPPLPPEELPLTGSPLGSEPASVLGIGLAVAIVLGVLLALASLYRARRSPQIAPDIAYRGVARLAGRFGYGPRPHQTAYEYAGILGELLPAMSSDLRLVARAKVETTYASRPPEAELLAQLRDAYRRVRIGLIRMAVRRRRLPARLSRRDR